MPSSKPGPHGKKDQVIKAVLKLSSYRRAWWAELASGKMITSCRSSKRPHRLICHQLALLVCRRFNFSKKERNQTFNSKCSVGRKHSKLFESYFSNWKSVHPHTPTPANLSLRDMSPSLRNFYFGSVIRHESKFVHRYTPARKEELWPHKPTPVNHTGQLCW